MKNFRMSLLAGWTPAKSLSIVLLLACALGELATPLRATDRHWTGSASGNWSNTNNWDPVGIPQTGETLIFDHDSNTSMNNDVPNLTVNTLNFVGTQDLVTSDFSLGGNPLTITNFVEQSSKVGHSYTVTISCALTMAPQAGISVGDGSDGLSPNELHLVGPIALNGNLSLFADELNQGSAIYLSGAVSGNGNAYLDEGKIIVDGAAGNTFNGSFTVGSEAIVGEFVQVLLNKQSGLSVPGQLNIIHGQVELGHDEQIGSLATVTIQNGSQFLLEGYNQHVGSLQLTNVSADADPSVVDTAGGTLTVNNGVTGWNDNASVTPVIKGIVHLDRVIPFYTGGSAYAGLDMQAQISGIGAFSKAGSSAMILEDNNTFTGDVEVDQGILDVSSAGAFNGSQEVQLHGTGQMLLRASISATTLTVDGNQSINTESSGSLISAFGATNLAWNGRVVLNTNLVVGGTYITFNGAISGAGGMDFRTTGTAQLGGTAPNTYSGTTLVRCPLLEFNKTPGTNAFSGPLVVGGGSGPTCEARWLNAYQGIYATLTLYANGKVNLTTNNEDFGAVTFNGGEVDTSSDGHTFGQFAIYQPLTVNPSTTSAVINGQLGLPACCDAVFIVGDGPLDCDLIVNAQIFGGAPYFRKQGPGKMCLTAANTYSGVTLIQEGILYVNNSTGLGSAGAVIFDGATLQLDGFLTLANGFEMVGAGVGGTHGAMEVLNSCGDLGCDAVLTGPILLDGATTVNAAFLASLELNGAISGSGPLTKIGAGTLRLGGSAANSYSGNTVATTGGLILNKPQFVTAVPGNLVIGPASASTPAFAQFNNSGQVAGTTTTVNAYSTLNLNGNAQTLAQLNLNDGGGVLTGTGVLRFSSAGAVIAGSQSPSGSHVHSAISGNVQIAANDTLTFTVNPYASSPPFDSAPELDVPATIYVDVENTQLVPTGIRKEGAGRMRLGGINTYKGNTTVNGGTLQADGSQPQSAVVVNSGAQVQGAGMVGPIYLNGSSAVLAPGDGLGILTSSNFDRGGGSGVLAIQLNGTTLGTGYNQLDVIGSVTLTGVTLSAQLNYPSAVNDQFTIINNDRSDAVIGTFNGLPQNSTLYIGGQLFQISYTGGTGNDVVLTRIPTPPLPTLTIQSSSSSSLVFAWPTNGPAFTLQANTNLTSSNWTTVSSAPTIVGANYVVTNAAAGPQGFYRLIH